MNREAFLAEFDYDVEKDFDVDHNPATWNTTSTKSAHRFWGDETYKIVVVSAGESRYQSGLSAISPDGNYVAVASGHFVGVYHVASQQHRGKIERLVDPCCGLYLIPLASNAGYQLVIACSDGSELNGKIYLLELNRDGQQVQDTPVLGIDGLVQPCMSPIIAELGRRYDLQTVSTLVDAVKVDLTKALEKLQSSLVTKDLTQLQGTFSGFGSCPVSADGRLLLILTKNQSTQDGNRPPSELPHIGIFDIGSHKFTHNVGGHEDAIMWTSFSPNDQYFASASWDGTFRICYTGTGACKHIIGPTGGQCWSGAWSPDSRHILLCGMANTHSEGVGNGGRGPLVGVYCVETGEQIARFKHERLRHWVREVAWSSRGDIAIAHAGELWVWNPFEDVLVTSFAVKVATPLMRVFAGTTRPIWAEGGKLLLHRNEDGTVEVWDRDRNVKWRMQRPKGAGAKQYTKGLHWAEKEKMVISFDGDGSLRFYKLE